MMCFPILAFPAGLEIDTSPILPVYGNAGNLGGAVLCPVAIATTLNVVLIMREIGIDFSDLVQRDTEIEDLVRVPIGAHLEVADLAAIRMAGHFSLLSKHRAAA